MKFSPQIHLFLCFAMLGNMLAPALVRADPPPPPGTICERINTAKAKTDPAELSRNRQKIFSSWQNSLIKDFSRQHRSLKYISKTSRSRSAQQSYMKYVTDNVTEICDNLLNAEKKVIAFAAELNKGSGAGMCSRFAEIESIYANANTNLAAVKGGLSQRLDHLHNILLEKADANRIELDDMDKAGINTNEASPLVTFPHSTGATIDANAKIETANTSYMSLRQELGMLWGKQYTTAKTTVPKSTKMDPNSFYGRILTEMEREGKKLDQINEQLTVQQQKMESTKNECAIVNGNDPVKATPASDQPDISGTEHTQKEGDLDPDAARLASNSASNTNTNTGTYTQSTTDTNTDTNTYTDPTLLNDDGRLKNPPYVSDTNTDTNTNTKTNTNTNEEGWISKNSGLLLTVGAGAAAVGGLLWYKNSQDKKAKRDAEALEMEANAMLAANSASSSSSTSTSTSTDSTTGGTPANAATPQGSKMVLSGIPSGSVAVNTKLPEITVAIINPAGILTQDSHTEIIVSCVQPAGCSLTGTGQAQTSAGKAKFSDLRFTQAHESVKLMFTSPGFDSVTSVSFAVTGDGGGTSTTTSTSTSTSTNTGGNRE